ncbi:hypothetical protein ACLK17_27205 [Escherichia coli]
MTHYYKKGNRYIHIHLLISDSYDPWFKLAVECLFSPDATTQHVLFLWRNADTVVIGRAPDPSKVIPSRSRRR